MKSAPQARAAPKRQLTVFDSVSIIVGIIIGAGIYRTSASVAGAAGGPEQMMFAWALGGVFVLAGALCYAELASTYPREGGEYVFLTAAFGRRAGFLFAWSEFWIIKPGSIGVMAFVFAEYALALRGGAASTLAYVAAAAAPIVVLSIVNGLGVQTGKWTQNVLSAVKVVGLLAVFVAAMWLAPPAQAAPAGNADFWSIFDPQSSSAFGLAMVFVLFTYGGWNDLSLVSAEIRDPQRSILRALLLGSAIVTAIYLLLNVAFLRVLGFDKLAASDAPASDLLTVCVGDWGGWAISMLICISCLGAINGMVFTCPRVYYALGVEHALYAWLGKWSARFDAPVRAIVIQAVVTVAMVAGFGFYEDGFDRLVIFTTPFFFVFLLLVGVALLVLRWKDRQTVRPYRVHLYPLPPLIFCAGCAFMLYSSVQYLVQQSKDGFHLESLWAIVFALAGGAASFFDASRSRPAGGE